MRCAVLVGVGMLMMAACGVAQERPTTGPKGVLSGTMVANKESYVLDPAQAGKEFRDKVEQLRGAGRGGGANAPMPPGVDLTLKITNTSEKAVRFEVGGDSSVVRLEVKGPGAVTWERMVPMTREFRMGTPVTLEPGKSHEMKISSLAAGERGMTQYSYWTEPGEYTVGATLRVTMEGEEKPTEMLASSVKVKVMKE